MSDKKHVEVAIALVWQAGELLISRRTEATHLGGLWEFPGGKIEPGESAEQCAVREVREEVGLVVLARRARAPIQHEYDDRTVTLRPIDCDWSSGEARALEVAEVRWVKPRDLAQWQFPAANAPLLAELGLTRDEP